ncbi:hypothetical protein DPMN_113896 [Dreissena polymorpha]|uniref:Uncharacterized protein n=1 Tax=Dreissena polymorpha TaxID=45954 RepID=A0A9D4KJI3_DREPO|nr:hypothetical protein DPMN_113896 [Dreissena polymorpha]
MPIRSTRSSPTKRSGTGLVVIGRASYPIFFDMSKISSSGRRSGSEDRVDREAIGSPEIGKMSCGGHKKSCIPFLVELDWVWSGNFGDRDDRVDRIGSGNPPLWKILH